ncbi:MAG TPA: CAP domain-containing protein, partial [Candidatus Bathyarchaeia archaeon]|nr:CAP domain-containing protein [Candidatus Bathyarchaeia archaeon]
MPPAARRPAPTAGRTAPRAFGTTASFLAFFLFLASIPPVSSTSPRHSLPVPQDQPQGKPAPPVITFDLRSVPSAAEYGTDPPEGPGFLGSASPALDQALAQTNRSLGAALRPDRRLALLSRWVYDRLGLDHALPPQSVFDAVTRRLGLPEPLPHVLVIDAQNVPRLSEAVSARLAKVFDLRDYTHIGGVAETSPETRSSVVVLVLSRRHLRLSPVPRLLERPGRVKIEGRLGAALANPELAHTLPSGETSVTDLGPGPAFNAAIRLAETGRHRLEILAQGPDGPDVLANIPVFVGVPVEDSIAASPASSDPAAMTPSAVRARLFELINDERSRAGLAPLAADPALDAAALRHSEDMLANDFVAHVSPTTGDTGDRLARAGVVTSLAADNIGRGYAPDEVHRGFMDSPGHRAAILLAEVTHVGIGVVSKTEYGRAGFLVTEIFIRRIPPLAADARTVFLETLNRRRASSGARPVRESPSVSEIADQAARDFLADPSLNRDETLARLADRLRGSPRRRMGRSFYSMVCVAPSLEEAAKQADSDPKTGRFDRLGL